VVWLNLIVIYGLPLRNTCRRWHESQADMGNGDGGLPMRYGSHGEGSCGL
jgi:hypothetical protein